MIDVSYGGTFMNKNEDDVYSPLKELCEDSSNYVSSSYFDRSKDIIYEIIKSEEKEFINEINELNSKIQRVLALQEKSNSSSFNSRKQIYTIYASLNHVENQCPQINPILYSFEQVQLSQSFNKINHDFL